MHMDVIFPLPEHDHRTCVEQAIARAHRTCAQKGIKLTELREAVLRVLLSSHQALGAYDIIEKLSKGGRRLAPISVYRIIEVLAQAGLIHRLESKNAFFACLAHHDNEKSVVVLVCENCHRVAEANAPEAWLALKSLTQANGFRVSETVLELQGTCASCGASHEAA